MKRLERLTALLSFLQSRRFTKVGKIASRFGISERTVYRDIQALNKAGVPIVFEDNKGYHIIDGHFLPPLAFTIDEAKSFVFVAQLAEKYTDDDTFKHFSNALEKIKNKLKHHQLEDIESAQSRINAYIDKRQQPQFLQLVERACGDKQILKLHYSDAHGRSTERHIEPIGITFYGQTWHVIAYCQLRNAYRDFSLLRVLELNPTNEISERNHLSLDEYILSLSST